MGIEVRMSDDWRNEFLGVLAHLDAHAEQRDLALAALHAVVAESCNADYVPLKVAAGRTGFSPETIRLWAVRQLIQAQLRGGRWFIHWASPVPDSGSVDPDGGN